MERPENKDQSVRVYFDGIGWGGPRLGIALDVKNENDKIYAESGVEYLVDPQSEELLKRYGGAVLDYSERSFYGSGFSLKLRNVNEC